MAENKYPLSENKQCRLSDFTTAESDRPSDSEIEQNLLPTSIKRLKELHWKLHAEGKHGIAVVLQALDAAGKDEAISHIFSYLNAQGLKTTNYGKPSEDEQKLDYLRRFHKGLPARGEIAIYNRSYYEEVIAPRIHGLEHDGKMPEEAKEGDVWSRRFRQINDFERYLHENGFHVIKFFFHVSKEEQRKRLLKRMKDPEKKWEFSFNDVKEREHWGEYEHVFEEMLTHTATSYAPWHVLPADDEAYSRYIIAQEMIALLEKINPQFPDVDEKDQEKMDEAIDKLEKERSE